jgi:uncharacterized membrane protein YdjX (TVP38/TMEM64 family)
MNQDKAAFSARRAAPLALLLAGLVAFFALGFDDYLSLDALREHRETLSGLAARYGLLANIAFIGLYAAVVAFSLPGGTVMTLLAGLLFGVASGGITATIGAAIGATLLFLAAKTALGDALAARAGGALRKLEDGFQKDAFNYLLVLRLIPVFPFWLVNLAPAFLGVRLRTYVSATVIGIIPGTFVFASIGNGLGAVLDAGAQPNLDIVFQPEILWPILGLAALALAPVIYKRTRCKETHP